MYLVKAVGPQSSSTVCACSRTWTCLPSRPRTTGAFGSRHSRFRWISSRLGFVWFVCVVNDRSCPLWMESWTRWGLSQRYYDAVVLLMSAELHSTLVELCCVVLSLTCSFCYILQFPVPHFVWTFACCSYSSGTGGYVLQTCKPLTSKTWVAWDTDIWFNPGMIVCFVAQCFFLCFYANSAVCPQWRVER